MHTQGYVLLTPLPHFILAASAPKFRPTNWLKCQIPMSDLRVGILSNPSNCTLLRVCRVVCCGFAAPKQSSCLSMGALGTRQVDMLTFLKSTHYRTKPYTLGTKTTRLDQSLWDSSVTHILRKAMSSS